MTNETAQWYGAKMYKNSGKNKLRKGAMMTNYFSKLWIGLLLVLLLPVAVLAETYTYDAAGRLTSATYADGSAIAYTYDKNGNILNKAVGAAPTITLALNGAAPFAFNSTTNKALTLTATTTVSPLRADVYVALQLPDGTLLVMQPGGAFSTALTPLVANIPIPAFNGQIFSFTFTGVEPVGNYTWFAALTTPGTLNIIGALATAPFSFAP